MDKFYNKYTFAAWTFVVAGVVGLFSYGWLLG